MQKKSEKTWTLYQMDRPFLLIKLLIEYRNASISEGKKKQPTACIMYNDSSTATSLKLGSQKHYLLHLDFISQYSLVTCCRIILHFKRCHVFGKFSLHCNLSSSAALLHHTVDEIIFCCSLLVKPKVNAMYARRTFTQYTYKHVS